MRRLVGKRYHMNGWHAGFFLLASAVLITYGMLRVQPVSWDIILLMARRPNHVMLWMNFLPVLLLLFFFYFCTGQPVFSVSLVGSLLMLLAVINRYKLIMRGDPLLHWDLTLFSEALETVRGFQMHSILIGLAGFITFACAAIFCCLKMCAIRIGGKARLYGATLTLLILFLSFDGLYGNKAVYGSLPVYGSFYNMADVFNSRGFLYSFLYTLCTQDKNDVLPKDEKSVAWAAAEMSIKNIESLQNGYRPNIIMIMGESFCDLSESGAFDFAGTRNPLENFLRMGEEGISGRLVVPSRGGGTADTEFDVLTANASRYLRNASYAYRLLTRPTEALPSILGKIGYRSFALHPGYRWFYNRQNVYPALGFSEAVFEDAFPEDAYLDIYIGEEAAFDKLLEMIDAYEEPDSPFFAFCLTIQNHAAYEDRFLPEGTVNFHTNIPLDEKEENILSNYFAGLTDADEQLKRLADTLNGREEPFLLIYFGDHLPSLPQALYDRLIQGADAPKNSLEKETRLYQTPFILWQNDAAKANDLLTGRKRTDTGLMMSSNYFGAYLLEVLGFEGVSSFFDYTNRLRPSLPVLLERFCFLADGEGMENPPQPLLDQLTLYKAWIRHQVYGD